MAKPREAGLQRWLWNFEAQSTGFGVKETRSMRVLAPSLPTRPATSLRLCLLIQRMGTEVVLSLHRLNKTTPMRQLTEQSTFEGLTSTASVPGSLFLLGTC